MQRVVQLTDLHLQTDPATLYKGINADDHLQQCLAWIMALKPLPDLLLLTGDLSHQGSQSAYQRLHGMLQETGIAHLWLAGNHDNKAVMESIYGAPVGPLRQQLLGDWQLLLLDSNYQSDDRGGGSISVVDLQQLQYRLQQLAIQPTLVVLHHNPVPVQSHWQDEIMLVNGTDLVRLLQPHQQVKAVICGHVHQVLDRVVYGRRFLAAPATSVQFSVQCEHFTLQSELGPGLRLLDLTDTGELSTQVQYLPKLSRLLQQYDQLKSDRMVGL
jgi:Icc protein